MSNQHQKQNGRFSINEVKRVKRYRFWCRGDLAQALTLAAVFCEQNEATSLHAEYNDFAGWSVLVIV